VDVGMAYRAGEFSGRDGNLHLHACLDIDNDLFDNLSWGVETVAHD